jgi:hypothetical protein
MPPRILVVALVTPRTLSLTLAELRRRYPKATVCVLGGGSRQGREPGQSQADEHLPWQSFTGPALFAEVRRRRFDLAAVAFGRDYYVTRVYWKALALALVCGARGVLFCEDGKLSGREVPLEDLTSLWAKTAALAKAAASGVARAAARAAAEAYVAAMGILLLPVLIGIAATDLTEAPAGASRAGRRAMQPRER